MEIIIHDKRTQTKLLQSKGHTQHLNINDFLTTDLEKACSTKPIKVCIK